MPKSFKRNLNVSLTLNEFTNEHNNFELFAYVFSKTGRLIEKKKLAFDEKQAGIAAVDFDLNLKDENVIVKFGPDVEDPTVLSKHSPLVEETILKEVKTTISLNLDKLLWTPWLRKPYCIRGSVVKLENGEELYIPYGEVDIYDIDIGFILRLRDDIIEKIRDAVLDVILNPPPVVFPKPEKEFKPSWWNDDYCGTPIGPRPPIGANIDISRVLRDLPMEWAFSRERYEKLTGLKEKISKKMMVMQPDEKTKWLDSEVLENIKMSSLIHTNSMQFKNLLVENFQSFRYYLCWFPWIYWLWAPHFWYNLEKLGTAKIKQDGSFSKLLWFPVRRRDVPDLWFVVRQQINGVDRRIYAHFPVPCNTYWNHPSTSPVKLIVTDPLAVAYYKEHDISEDDGLWVCPLSIGNYSLKNIYGTGAVNDDNTYEESDIGKYKEIRSGLDVPLSTFKNGPFGGFIGLRVLFSSSLLEKNVKYYKLKYRSNGAGDWYSSDHEVKRHYSHYNSSTKVLEFLPYHIGPHSVGSNSNLFEIRPKYPPNKASEPESDWYVLDATVDLISGYINTKECSNGYIEIKLELYDKNGARINPSAFDTGIQFKLPSNTDIFNTIMTEDAASVNPALVKADPENNAYQAFIFKLRIDNSITYAAINTPVVLSSGNVATDCGIIHYEPADDKVRLAYEARHPGTFAMYSLNILRSTDDIISITGKAGDMGKSGNFELEPYIKLYSPTSTPYLLNSCHNDAAFDMHLYLWNMAFNGWNRIGSDASATRAFALVPSNILTPVIVK